MGARTLMSALRHLMPGLALGSAMVAATTAYAAPPAEAPLSASDVALYLKVMHAAADRLHHPTPEDRDLLRRAKISVAAVQETEPGHVRIPDFAALNRSMALNGGTADDLIVQEQHLDRARYDRVVHAVEDAVPSPTEAIGDGGGMSSKPYVPTAQDRAAAALKAQNQKTLAPYRAEIRALEADVRKSR